MIHAIRTYYAQVKVEGRQVYASYTNWLMLLIIIRRGSDLHPLGREPSQRVIVQTEH